MEERYPKSPHGQPGPATCLVILGTASDVGKSIVATALCRIFHQQGWRVAPYKAQNMSNNSYVSITQGELARAQAVQAEAARLEPSVDMNPVLLKPSGDTVSQVVLRGQAIGNRFASDYFSDTTALFREALQSLNRLRSQYDLIVIEGAGSCAEVNLRSRDFTNLELAHYTDAPAILVADIDRGGVFAQIVGTLEVLDQRDRDRIRGFIINRFRGDPRLFDDGIRYLESRTGLPVLGLVPYFSDIHIDSEDGLPDAVPIDPPSQPHPAHINLAVILLPHISNFTDFAPFQQCSGVELHYLRKPRDLEGYDLVLIPGSKNTRADLSWCHQIGWSERLVRYAEQGGRLGGICGGYQMLGTSVHDPHGVEGEPGGTEGLGLLPVETSLGQSKVLHRTTAVWGPSGHAVQGYEIHHGLTRAQEAARPLLQIQTRDGLPADEEDGCMSTNGRIWGCYLHGIFDSPEFRNALLSKIGAGKDGVEPIASGGESPYDFRQRQYDLLADHFRRHLDLDRLCRILGATNRINPKRA